MKFRVTMKCPDALDEAILSAAEEECVDVESEGKDIELNAVVRRLHDQCCKWFKHGETLTVEIDTDTQTCIVLPEHASTLETIEAVILNGEGSYVRAYDKFEHGTDILVFESLTHPTIEIHIKE